MKKKLLFIFLFAFTFLSYAQFPENFDGTTFPPTGWTTFRGTNGLGTAQDWRAGGTPPAYAISQFENVTGGLAEDWLVTPQFTVDATNVMMKFRSADNYTPDYGSVYTIRVSTASQTTHADFTIIKTLGETDMVSQTFTTFYADLSAYVGQAIYVAFVHTNDNGDVWYLDAIDLIPAATAPNEAITPTPADGAVDVFVDPTDGPDADTLPDNKVSFSWQPATSGGAPTVYEFYLGTSATALNKLGEVPTTSINLVGMNFSTQYFWKVVPKNSGGVPTTPATWSFTTGVDTASVLDEELKTSVSIFPTTANDIITIKNNSDKGLNKISIYDLNGKVVLQQELDNLKGIKTINVSNLSSGLYFVELNTEKAKVVKKMIKK